MKECTIERMSAEELREMMADVMSVVLKQLELPGKERKKYLTREETAKLLRVSLPTLNEYTKKGVIKGYRIQGRVLYLEDEVVSSLHEIVSVKYKRSANL